MLTVSCWSSSPKPLTAFWRSISSSLSCVRSHWKTHTVYNLDAPSGNLVGDIVILVSLLHVCNGLPLRTIVRINGILAMMILLQSRGDYNMLLWMIGSMVLLWCQGACFLVCVSNRKTSLIESPSWRLSARGALMAARFTQGHPVAGVTRDPCHIQPIPREDEALTE